GGGGSGGGLAGGGRAAVPGAEGAAQERGLEPTLRLVTFAFAGVEPELMGLGPVPATKKALQQAGLSLDQIDAFELNEPFAVQVLSWCDGTGVSPDDERLNPYAAALPSAHPLAATAIPLLPPL